MGAMGAVAMNVAQPANGCSYVGRIHPAKDDKRKTPQVCVPCQRPKAKDLHSSALHHAPCKLQKMHHPSQKVLTSHNSQSAIRATTSAAALPQNTATSAIVDSPRESRAAACCVRPLNAFKAGSSSSSELDELNAEFVEMWKDAKAEPLYPPVSLGVSPSHGERGLMFVNKPAAHVPSDDDDDDVEDDGHDASWQLSASARRGVVLAVPIERTLWVPVMAPRMKTQRATLMKAASSSSSHRSAIDASSGSASDASRTAALLIPTAATSALRKTASYRTASGAPRDMLAGRSEQPESGASAAISGIDRSATATSRTSATSSCHGRLERDDLTAMERELVGPDDLAATTSSGSNHAAAPRNDDGDDDDVMGSEAGRAAAASGGSSSVMTELPIVRLAAKLLLASSEEGSFWWRYATKMMPNDDMDGVSDWSDEEIAELQSPAAMSAALSHRDDVAAMEAAVLHQLRVMSSEEMLTPPDAALTSSPSPIQQKMISAPALLGWSEEEQKRRAKWAVRMVMSRSFTCRIDLSSSGSAGNLSASVSSSSARDAASSASKFAAELSSSGAGGTSGTPPQVSSPSPESLSPPPEAAAAAAAATAATAVQLLVPLADMANHHHEPTVAWSMRKVPKVGGRASTSFVFSLDERRTRGSWSSSSSWDGQNDDGTSEVTISYGPQPSLAFLLSFGFVPHPNPSNRILVYHHLQEMVDDVDYRIRCVREKEELLQCMVVPTRPLFAHSGGSSRALMDCLIVLHATTREELLNFESTWRKHHSLIGARVKSETRFLAAEHLCSRCSSLLSSYPSSLDEDTKMVQGLLAKDKRSARLLLALQYRMQEKTILQDVFTSTARFLKKSPLELSLRVNDEHSG